MSEPASSARAVVVVLVGAVAGAATARLLGGAHFVVSVAILSLIWMTFYLWSRHLLRSDSFSYQLAAMISYVALFGIGVGFSLLPGPGGALQDRILGALLRIGLALSLAIVPLALVLREKMSRAGGAPLRAVGVHVLPAAIAFVAVLVVCAGTILAAEALKPGSWQLAFLLSLVPALALSHYITARVHLWVRMRAIGRLPKALAEAIEYVAIRTGFRFHHVVAVDRSDGPPVCEVVSYFGRHWLVVSESLGAMLTAPQLVALIAHESAHPLRHHSVRRGLFVAVAGLFIVTLSAVVQLALAQVFEVPPFVRAIVVGAAIGVARHLYGLSVSRRFEQEADEFAVAIAGPLALIQALEKCWPSRDEQPNRWTSHGTWARRRAWILSKEPR